MLATLEWVDGSLTRSSSTVCPPCAASIPQYLTVTIMIMVMILTIILMTMMTMMMIL